MLSIMSLASQGAGNNELAGQKGNSSDSVFSFGNTREGVLFRWNISST